MQFDSPPHNISYPGTGPEKKESPLIDVFSVNMKSLDDVNGTQPFNPQPQNPSYHHISPGRLELENETSSTESFPLMDSTEAPSSFTSHFSSSSSFSGFFKSPRSSIGTPSTGHNSKRRDSRSDSGSFTSKRDKKKNAVKKAYLKLQSQCNKFKSQNNALKANYLRLTLLPFLRNHTGESNLLPANSQVELAIKVFTGWWSECLDVLKSNFKNVAGVDRDAFYEAVSSLMARPEWLDHMDKPAFQNLLSNTLIHLLTKCATSMHLPISLSAITGKCLAYSYLYLPYVAVYLLDLLDISPTAIKRLGDVNIEQFLSSYNKSQCADYVERLTPRSTPTPAVSGTNSSSSTFQQASFINSFLHYHHPSYLESLVDAREKPSIEHPAYKMPWFPFDNFRNWKRYFTIDSPLFVSFFKHLCVLQTQCLPISSIRDGVEFGDETKFFAMHGESTILNSPGMRLIFASIVTHLDKVAAESGRSTSPRNANPYDSKSGQESSSKGRYGTRSRNGSSSTLNDNFTADAVASPYNSASSGANLRFRADRLKLFTAIREILHSDETTVPYVLAYSRIFDRIFRAFALNIRAYDVDRCVMACDLAEEWIYSVAAVRATKACPALVSFRSLTLDWDIWILVMKRMLSTDNIHTEIRALSFLYNVWPYLPNSDSQALSSASNSNESLTTKSSSENSRIPITPMMQSSVPSMPDSEPKTTVNVLTEWLLSTKIWLKFFCHWCPLVRSYYHRLVCYRMASVGEESGSWFLDVESVQCISESRKLLQHRLVTTFLWCNILSENTKMRPEVVPSLPMPRMRVGVRPVGPSSNSNGGKVETNVSRVFPFDVFDSAAYWQRDLKGEEESIAIHSGVTPQSPSSGSSIHSSSNSSRSSNSQLFESPDRNGSSLSRASSSPQLRSASPYNGRSRSSSRASSIWSNSSTTSTIGEVSPSDEFPDRGADEVGENFTKPSMRGNAPSSSAVVSGIPEELNPIPPTPEIPSTPERNERPGSPTGRESPLGGSFSSMMASSPLRLRRKDKMSHSSPNMMNESEDDNIKSRSSSLTNLKGSYLQKRWGSLRKLITGKESSETALEEGEDSKNESAQPCSQLTSSQTSDKNAFTPKKELKAPFTFEDISVKTHIGVSKSAKRLEKQNYIKATPVELTKPRPEVVRPPHRFVMIPTTARPPMITEIQLPKLPFSSRVKVDESMFDCQNRNQDKDLAIWNYAGRSLAEWNIEVSCFESFIKLQEKKFNETLEMFNMPFLVAEIPWKTLG